MEKNVLLTIAYDGSGFSGWQRQPDKLTVQGYLEKTMSSLFKRDIILNGTSRTDAGVHALGQCASFTMNAGIPVDRLPRVVNNALCGKEKGPFAISPVRIVSAEEKPAGFHARFDCRGKKYIYSISNTGDVDIFRRNYTYHVDRPLDVDSMRRAAEALKGTHDFKSFESSGGNPRQTTVRTVFDIELNVCEDRTKKQGDTLKKSGRGKELELCITGDGFLYNMVRIITGTLVDIGLGKIPCDHMKKIIEAKDRTAAGHTAPPYGLYLAEVHYEDIERR